MHPALLLALAAPLQAESQSSLMDAVERAVTLPRGAQPLSAYARHYAFDGPDRVVAIYLLHLPPTDWRTCATLRDGAFTPCTAESIRLLAEKEAQGRRTMGGAGSRRWHAEPKAMPRIFDGECMQVNVTFDTTTRRATAECNGVG